MILKGIKKEGRIRIYIASLVLFVFGGAAWELPGAWKLLGVLLLSGTYIYVVTRIGKEFAYKKGGKK